MDLRRLFLCCRGRSRNSESHSHADIEEGAETSVSSQRAPQIRLTWLGDGSLAISLPTVLKHLQRIQPGEQDAQLPRVRPSRILPSNIAVEEETNPRYDANTWYHARIGDVLEDRYRICTKLGWGDTSTVWLAEDVRNGAFVSIKICANPTDQRTRELDLLQHITGLNSNHPGAQSVARLREHFYLHRNDFEYLCLVSEVLGPNLAVQVNPELRELDIDWIKELLYRLLQAVDFLHTEAYIVHGDIWAPNVLCALPNRQALHDLDNLEQRQPSDRKQDSGVANHVVYNSRAFEFPSSRMPVLIDFGNSRLSVAAAQATGQSIEALREKENIRCDEAYRSQRDFQWIGRMFINMINDKGSRTLTKMVPLLRPGCPSMSTTKVTARADERQQLLDFLWKMKKSNDESNFAAATGAQEDASSVNSAAVDRAAARGLTARELLADRIFVDPEHRHHHTW